MSGSLRLLPLLIIVAFLAFSVRLSEVVIGVSHLSGTAFAETKSTETPPPSPDAPAAEHKSEEVPTPDKTAAESMDPPPASKDGVDIVKDGETVDAPKWRDAGDSDLDISSVKMEMFNDLSKRRDQLDQTEKELKVREALLKAADKELDRKFQELTKLRQEIEGLLNKQSEEENARITSLVKIYEGMKPQDSARIFDTLDIDVLVSVISKMSERKVAPVLAAMSPERARTVTIMLAEQKTLPTLK